MSKVPEFIDIEKICSETRSLIDLQKWDQLDIVNLKKIMSINPNYFCDMFYINIKNNLTKQFCYKMYAFSIKICRLYFNDKNIDNNKKITFAETLYKKVGKDHILWDVYKAFTGFHIILFRKYFEYLETINFSDKERYISILMPFTIIYYGSKDLRRVISPHKKSREYFDILMTYCINHLYSLDCQAIGNIYDNNIIEIIFEIYKDVIVDHFVQLNKNIKNKKEKRCIILNIENLEDFKYWKNIADEYNLYDIMRPTGSDIYVYMWKLAESNKKLSDKLNNLLDK